MTPEEYVKKYLKKPEISNVRGTAMGEAQYENL